MPSVKEIVDIIKEVARVEIRKDFRADSCIASTRVVIRVLKHFGIAAQPFPVKLYIFNPGYVKQVSLGNMPPRGDDETLAEWCERYGAWSVAVGVSPNNRHASEGAPGYVGHLIALLPEHHIAIDASADQAHRPQHNIHMPGVLSFPYSDTFAAGTASQFFEHPNGAVMEYRPDPGNLVHKISPDWNDKSRTKRAVKAVISAIESSRLSLAV